ncbi:MAG: polymer-forming cytoskeletal protein [Candidatus Dadabacteria bacterium]|nr:polymer-forming cytoskeletal protein [Candidatus Dadabacteria bacterium]
MNRLIIFLGLSVLLFTLPAFSAKEQEEANLQTGELVTVPSGEVINKDYFAFGEKVEISGTINGDLYAAGGQILIDGTINGDLLAAGGKISISGKISQDARIIGGQIIIDGEIGRNLTASAGNIELTDSAKVSGTVVAGGGSILLAAPIGKDVMIAARNLTVSDKISGNLKACVGSLRLTSKAEISGDLTYWSDEKASIDENAKILGSVTQKTPPKPSPEKMFGIFAGFYLFVTFISFISTLIIGLLLIYLYPKYNRDTVSTLRKRPLASLGIGFVTLVVAPIALILIFSTIVGIPLALILLASYLITVYLARIYVIFWGGLYIFERLGKTVHEGWAFFVGLIVYFIITLIPIIGGIIAFLVLLSGLGALVLTKKELYQTLRKQNII